MAMDKLFDRIVWASEHLKPVTPQYVVCFQEPGSEHMSVLNPAPEWLAMAMHGGLLPPVQTYLDLRCKWTHHDGRECLTLINEHPGQGWDNAKVINGEILHTTPPIDALSEEAAMEYLVQMSVPLATWADHDTANTPRFVICKRKQLPKSRLFRDAWRILPPELMELAA